MNDLDDKINTVDLSKMLGKHLKVRHSRKWDGYYFVMRPTSDPTTRTLCVFSIGVRLRHDPIDMANIALGPLNAIINCESYTEIGRPIFLAAFEEARAILNKVVKMGTLELLELADKLG